MSKADNWISFLKINKVLLHCIVTLQILVFTEYVVVDANFSGRISTVTWSLALNKMVQQVFCDWNLIGRFNLLACGHFHLSCGHVGNCTYPVGMWAIAPILWACGQFHLSCGHVGNSTYPVGNLTYPVGMWEIPPILWAIAPILRACGQFHLSCGHVGNSTYPAAIFTYPDPKWFACFASDRLTRNDKWPRLIFRDDVV